MTQPKSIEAYRDCEEKFEEALNSQYGIAVTLSDAGLAIRFIQKMNAYRTMLRKKNKEIYSPDDPHYNTSPYDAYKVSQDKNDKTRVLIRKYEIKVVKTEPLGPEV